MKRALCCSQPCAAPTCRYALKAIPCTLQWATLLHTATGFISAACSRLEQADAVVDFPAEQLLSQMLVLDHRQLQRVALEVRPAGSKYRPSGRD